MKILVVGSGGREHAIAWKISQSSQVTQVYVAPGNAGTALDKNLKNVNLTQIPDLLQFAKTESIHYTVVGPEAPLAEGIVDEFRKEGLKIFGPTKAAAQLESSKDFAKEFMHRHDIPTAQFQTFTDIEKAKRYIQEHGAPIVVKADGLAAGKGVVVASTVDEALSAVDMMLSGNQLGNAGHRVVIEDFLDGEEASFIVMVDGKHVVPLASSQDHKRLLDNDQGPNTGGMGAYSPAPVITPDIHAKAMREVIMPTVQGMTEEGITYTGFLYAGLMIDKAGGVKVLEFNCRMGDPETQPIMFRLKSDLAELFDAAVNGKLDEASVEWDRRPALGVVMAAEGYPVSPRKGDAVSGIPANNAELHTFHAGTTLTNDQLSTSGGRVLCVTALGDNLKIARSNAYEAVNQISFSGMQMRRDIGWRALNQSKK